MKTNSYLVPSKAESMIFGFDAVEIGVRKAYLIKDGKRAKGRFYSATDKPHEKRFCDWVEFLDN